MLPDHPGTRRPNIVRESSAFGDPVGVGDGRRVMRCVLVGGGVAAAATAATLRRRGYDGEIVLVSEEPDAPYERPPLSKDVLVGGDVVPARKPEWYGDNRVELRLSTRA